MASHDRDAVYLTGSHIWNNLHDGMGPGAACRQTAEQFDYSGYLDFLAEHGHDFAGINVSGGRIRQRRPATGNQVDPTWHP